jgi:hypothetical protein
VNPSAILHNLLLFDGTFQSSLKLARFSHLSFTKNVGCCTERNYFKKESEICILAGNAMHNFQRILLVVLLRDFIKKNKKLMVRMGKD